MSDQKFSWELFNRVPIIGIVRGLTLQEVITILPVFREAGLTNIEVTMNTIEAVEIIRYGKENYGTTLNIGAGTVCTKDDFDKAIEAGAQFIVTPIVRKKIIRSCVKQGLPVFPGALTPSEIYKAHSLGASMVKLFPAKTLGPDYIKDVKAPLDKIKLLPTGGIDIDNIESFKRAGADGYGIGSPLFKKSFIEAKDWQGLREHFERFVEKVKVT